jgi:aspartyl-tRNA(Asn)/glutamyl-tRNA(Gln) amidotransferase subunit A
MTTLINRSAVELLGLLQSGQTTSAELTAAFLKRITDVDGRVKAFLRVDPPAAMKCAEEIDAKRKSGKPLGRLAGLPVAVKDVLCTEGQPTTCASKILENFRPPYDATVVARLKAADAVLIGKTNMDEFAMGGSNENSAYFPARNPWDTGRIPGGSSGGSAACIAARMTPLSLGSDTGGSIRCPAALCGITGMKPTYGRVSRFGLVAFASSLDQIGPMGENAEDCALLLEVLAGHDPRDSTSVDRPVPNYSQSVKEPLKNLRIGWVREHFGEGLDGEVEAAVREAIRVYESLGATVKELSLPHGKYAVATYYVIAPCEASSNLARYDGVHFGHRTDEKAVAVELEAQRKELQKRGDAKGLDALDNALIRMYRRSRSEGFGAEVKRRIMLGTYALSAGYYDAYYKKALQVRRLIRQDFDQAFAEIDLIVGPVTPSPAFRIGEKIDNPLEMYLYDLYTVSTNLAGIAAISVPCGFSSTGLPIGLHLQAPPFEEERLLRGAAMFQQATGWHTRRPEI